MSECLYNRICSIEILHRAWEKVQAKGSAGGIDGITVKEFEKNSDVYLEDLSRDLKSCGYIPEPYKQVAIPKAGGEHRILGIPALKDKIVQQAVKEIVEPIFEREFLNVSYAYRPGKGPVKAIRRVSHLLENEKRLWVSLCDIDRYFDTIDHVILFSLLATRIRDEKVLALIRLWVKMGSVDTRGRWKDSVKGIPQGGVISPLLSNLYLHPFDQYMVQRNFGLVRYADDFVLLNHTGGEAYRALEETKRFLENNLKLRLNPGAAVEQIHRGFEFLGVFFRGGERVLTEEKKEKLKNRIAESFIVEGKPTLEKFVEIFDGMRKYYGLVLSQGVLEELDEWVVGNLKEHLNTIYRSGVLKYKQDLELVVSQIHFLSIKYEVYRRRVIREIVLSCRKGDGKKKVEEKCEEAVDRKVRKRKREYQKRESEGLDLLVTVPGTFLGKTRKGITVKKRGVKIYEAPLRNLKHISIISMGVTISSNVIKFCVEKGISIDFLEFTGKPYAKIITPSYPRASLGIAQLRSLEDGKGCLLAKEFVKGKVMNQINILKYIGKYRKKRDEDFSEIFEENIASMKRILEEVDRYTDRDIDVLRGKLFSVEGRAAYRYWELVERMLNDYVEFEGRVRRGASDLVNSLLNYGYGVLYSRIWESLLAVGLNPYISYLHKPQEGKPTLVYDLIEEFRQQGVDRPVFSLLTKGEKMEMKGKILSPETRKRVAEKVLERLNRFEKFRGIECRFFDIIRHQAQSVAEYISGESKKYRPYVGKW